MNYRIESCRFLAPAATQPVRRRGRASRAELCGLCFWGRIRKAPSTCVHRSPIRQARSDAQRGWRRCPRNRCFAVRGGVLTFCVLHLQGRCLYGTHGYLGEGEGEGSVEFPLRTARSSVLRCRDRFSWKERKEKKKTANGPKFPSEGSLRSRQ